MLNNEDLFSKNALSFLVAKQLGLKKKASTSAYANRREIYIYTDAHLFVKRLRLCIKLVFLSAYCVHESRWINNFTELAKIVSSDNKYLFKVYYKGLKFYFLKPPAGIFDWNYLFSSS